MRRKRRRGRGFLEWQFMGFRLYPVATGDSREAK
jgi:hypothetical protein